MSFFFHFALNISLADDGFCGPYDARRQAIHGRHWIKGALVEQQSELKRSDVLELLEIASNMRDGAISRLLTKFCDFNDNIRFASLWQMNRQMDSISIRSRSDGDYRPQL